MARPLSVKKVEVQEALPPAGVIGAEPLTLVPQHFPRKPEDEDSPKGYRSPKPATHSGAGRKALFAGNSGQLGFFRQAERDVSPNHLGKRPGFLL